MNFMNHLANFTTVEEGEQNLIAAKKLRDSMGGDMYYQACNDDVKELEHKLFLFKLKAGKKQTIQSDIS